MVGQDPTVTCAFLNRIAQTNRVVLNLVAVYAVLLMLNPQLMEDAKFKMILQSFTIIRFTIESMKCHPIASCSIGRFNQKPQKKLHTVLVDG